MKKNGFTPLHPESPNFVDWDERQIKIKSLGKPRPVTKVFCNGTRPLGRGVTGFTLIELLIAASIFSIIILSLYSVFQSGILIYKRVDSAFGLYQTARIVLNRVELDLKNAFTYSSANSKFIGTSSNLDFFSVVDSFESLEASSNICRIKYELNNNILKRFCYQGLGAIKENPEIEGEELSEDIKEISFEYAYATENKDKPYAWQDAWPKKEEDTSQQKNLPLAVKIKLGLIERDKAQNNLSIVEFTRTIPLPL